MRRGRLVLWALQAVLLTLGVLAASAIACEGAGEEKAESTTLSTKLSGESKEGEELTILEGSKAKDKATLSGKNASKATGKVTYKVYSEKECKTLVTSAGEVTVSGESVPVSSEEELEGGKTYYWQAHYSGDSKNKESTSPCTEILNVKAKTSLATKLSGESKEAEELTVLEGAKVKDKATLSGTNFSTATGKVLYKVYSEKECKTLVKEAGEVTVSSGSVPASSEEELEGGKTYYWQATYKGDTLHQESTSTCGKEVLSVKAKTKLSLELTGEGSEGEEITISGGEDMTGKATLSGTNSSTAGGEAVYDVYSEDECNTLITAAGEVTVSSGSVPVSSEEELESGETYYWQVTYKGDALHQESKSICGKGDAKVNPFCSKPFCEPTITPGVEIKVVDVGKCTAGPIMTEGAKLFQVTAGHCFADEPDTTEEVKSAYTGMLGEEKKIGSTGTATKSIEYDVGEVEIENSEWLLPKKAAAVLLVEWEATPKVAVVTKQKVSAAGEETCFTGSQSGLHCGEILRTAAADPTGTVNTVETTINGVGGDSGSPEYKPEAGVFPKHAAIIQGIFIEGKDGGQTKKAKGKLKNGIAEITEWKQAPKEACAEINKMKEKWGTKVPVEGTGIPPKTTVTECVEAVATTTLKMSNKATKEEEVEVTVGQKELGWYEPMSEIDARYPVQKLLTK
jgi:uncharacterized protein YacL (UPF0231 family)